MRDRNSERIPSQPSFVVIHIRLRLPPDVARTAGLPEQLTIPLKLAVVARQRTSLTPFARLVRTATAPRLPQSWMN